MGIKRRACIFLSCIIILGVLCMPKTVAAEGVEPMANIIITRATGKFEVEIPGGDIVRASSAFPLEAGEKVSINASYSPRTASLDFGLIDPDNLFHPVTASGGSFNETFVAGKRGSYTLAIRNNSSNTVEVVGFVNY